MRKGSWPWKLIKSNDLTNHALRGPIRKGAGDLEYKIMQRVC